MKRGAIMVGLVTGFGALLLYAALAADTPSPKPAAEAHLTEAALGQPAPDFRLRDSYGKEFTLGEFKGKIVVVEWVFRKCPVSRGAHEKGQMQSIYKKYADKGVVWLGIDSSQIAEPEQNRVYGAQMGLNYPVLNDADGKVGRSYKAKTTPHMFVIDQAGKLAYNGAIDDHGEKNYVTATLEDLLAGRPVAKPRTDPYGCSIKYAPQK